MRSLTSHTVLRTNPFEVNNRLAGVAERLSVNHRQELADALAEKLDALAQRELSSWHPEVLALLLELSDQPTFKTKLSDLECPLPPDAESPSPLRWEDIAREDDWNEDEAIWKCIRYADVSAEATDYDDDDEDGPDSSLASDLTSDSFAGKTPQDLIVHTENPTLLDRIRKSQAWRTQPPPHGRSGHSRKVPVREIHAIREILFMLRGLRTTLFDRNCAAVATFQMQHLAWDTHRAVMNSFSEPARQLSILRAFVAELSVTPHLQVFQDCIAKRLETLDERIAEIETSLASPDGEAIVSLMGLRSDLAPSLEPLSSLAGILEQVSGASNSSTFYYLELLFDEACAAQLAGKTVAYDFLARIFVECFNVYLQPIRLWMDQGRLIPEDEIFFVCESHGEVALGNLWRDRFQLRRRSDGTLHAPRFLHQAALQIFTSGKNIVVLRKLGKFDTRSYSRITDEPPLNYDVMASKGLELAPFWEWFDAAFDKWIQSKYRKTSMTLRDELFHARGVASALDALHHLYLLADGSAAEAFCDDLFSKIDTLDSRWHNRFALTAVGQDVFASYVDVSRLTITASGDDGSLQRPAMRETVRAAVAMIRVQYRLPWPAQMVISADSLQNYQSVFTFLLQTRKALYGLHRCKVLDNQKTDDEEWGERSLFYSCRSSLLWFCTSVQSYLSTLVLAPRIRNMRERMSAAPDVDTMISIHSSCLKQVVDEACLGSRLGPIHAAIVDVFDLAIGLEEARSSQARSVTLARPYADVLRSIQREFDKNLRFIVGGLRSVARATSDGQSERWDMLAETLHQGAPGRDGMVA